MSSGFGGLSPLTTVNLDQSAVRNIVSLRESIDFLDDLTDDPAQLAHGRAAEAAAKPPSYRDAAIIHRPFDEAKYHAAICYPFEHWTASRFSDGGFGVWYGADSLETTVHETVFHWLRRVRAIAGYEREREILIERRVHDVWLRAILLDLRPHVLTHAWLVDPDPANYPRTQQLGAELRAQGQPGLATRSARCEGDVYALFTERVLSNPRVRCYLTYRYRPGAAVVQVQREPGTTLLEVAAE